MRVDLNKHESVTVTLRSKGGGQIWIRAYGERSPMRVWTLNKVYNGFDANHKQALLDHARGACRDRRTYRECISWTG